jgi:putative intracellular protease/amidase
MSHGTVLVIGSNATRIEVRGGGDGPTGNYLNETVVPIFAILAAGYDVVLGTPTGGKPHIDEASDSAAHFGGDTAAYQRARDYFANDKAMNDVRSLRSVIDDGLDKIDAIFVPGGQAPVVDLMQDPDMGEILRYFHENNKITALLCHGPIATLAALPDAKAYRAALVAGDTEKAAALGKGWQYAGYHMTVFSASEEAWVENEILHAKVYFTMPNALSLAGGKVKIGKDFEPNLVEDRELITGQNPRTDHLIGDAIVRALQRNRAVAG